MDEKEMRDTEVLPMIKEGVRERNRNREKESE